MEEWRALKDFPGYEVSSLGRVRSLRRVHPIVLRPKISNKGYQEVRVSKGNISVSCRVHRLVCETFHGPPPPDKPFCLHRDDDPSNNTPTNLRWGSRTENATDALLNDRYLRGEACGSSTHNQSTIRAMISDRNQNNTPYSVLSKRYGISKSQANKICRGQYWKHLPNGPNQVNR